MMTGQLLGIFLHSFVVQRASAPPLYSYTLLSFSSATRYRRHRFAVERNEQHVIGGQRALRNRSLSETVARKVDIISIPSKFIDPVKSSEVWNRPRQPLQKRSRPAMVHGMHFSYVRVALVVCLAAAIGVAVFCAYKRFELQQYDRDAAALAPAELGKFADPSLKSVTVVRIRKAARRDPSPLKIDFVG